MIGIICGGGDYPKLIANACMKKNEDFCALFLDGFCSEDGWHSKINRLTIHFGEIEKGLAFFKRNSVTKIIFAGTIRRPTFSQLSLDKTAAAWLLKLGAAKIAGDDVLLRAVSALLQEEGFQVVSGTDFLDNVFISNEIITKKKPTDCEKIDIQIGIKAAKELGAQDIGQAVMVFNEQIIGREDNDGTNALIQCSANHRDSSHGGVLVKAKKPQQDDRLDLPAIGVETINYLHENGFSGVAIEANSCIVVNKSDVIKRADELNIFVAGCEMSKKIFIIAGEPSGDYLGGSLMHDISATSDEAVEFFGIGGQHMQKGGLRLLFSVDKLSIIGIFEVIGKIFHIKKLIDKTVHAILQYKPDVLVTIDSSGFTHRVSKRVKKINPQIKIIHYVAPPVWAWRPWRAKTIGKFIDKLMVLLPFESDLFEKYGLKTVFVGHPISTDDTFNRPSENELKKINNKEDKSLTILLLPGSRISEINNHMPVLEKFTNLMREKYKNVKFIIPTIESIKTHIEQITKHWGNNPDIITETSEKVRSYYAADLAIAASGTVTLELARAVLPFIVIYKISPITYFIIKLLIKIPHVCLINILAKKNIVPELLQNNCTADKIFEQAKEILANPEQQKSSLQKILLLLQAEPMKAAKEVLGAIRK